MLALALETGLAGGIMVAFHGVKIARTYGQANVAAFHRIRVVRSDSPSQVGRSDEEFVRCCEDVTARVTAGAAYLVPGARIVEPASAAPRSGAGGLTAFAWGIGLRPRNGSLRSQVGSRVRMWGQGMAGWKEAGRAGVLRSGGIVGGRLDVRTFLAGLPEELSLVRVTGRPRHPGRVRSLPVAADAFEADGPLLAGIALLVGHESRWLSWSRARPRQYALEHGSRSVVSDVVAGED
jgi:hypothetical protein